MMKTNYQRRRTPNSRRHQKTRPLARTIGMISAGALALGGVVVAAVMAPTAASHTPTVAATLVYTPADAQTAEMQISPDLKEKLTQIAMNGDLLRVIRIDGDCHVTATTKDMTPRTANGVALNIPSDIQAAIEAEIEALQKEINASIPGTVSRCLYAGLLSARIPHDVPLFILTNGLDLTSPLDFRDLAWETPVDQLIGDLNAAKAVPNLTGVSVDFYLAYPTGGQEMRDAQLQYLEDIWSGVLMNAGAISVNFIEAEPGDSGSSAQVPIVPLPDLIGTPVAMQHDAVMPAVLHCTLPTVASFIPYTATIIHEADVRKSLTNCVAEISDTSTVQVDGWAAYTGPVNKDGVAINPGNITLSQQRADKIKQVLISMGVPEGIITTKGWGAQNQPDPTHPKWQTNRVCIITVTPGN